ncbi:hypothetical protein V499_02670 [Pseudogymnoascus sp. VKM F-103]|nr:hypothetical protein V499_02670 [Pseudogymnoascus sp. VKM F-103]
MHIFARISAFVLLLSVRALATSEIKGGSACNAGGRIDVHSHFLPPVYTDVLAAHGGDPSGWPTPKWDLSLTDSLNANLSIATSILSLTSPGASIIESNVTGARLLAREVNEYAAAIVQAQPKKYGFFAALPPLTDLCGTLTEIAYALDVLKADGVTLYTRYGDSNLYLGHPQFSSIWQELNRRAAVVFIHPTTSVYAEPLNSLLPQPALDYPHETARTAFNIVASGLLTKISNSPYTAAGISSDLIFAAFKFFYYDLALPGSQNGLSGITQVALSINILFGSDFPYAPTGGINVPYHGPAQDS